MRELQYTELWADLLMQSHQLDKTKNFRYLVAVRGPADCDYGTRELQNPLLVERVLTIMDDTEAQLLVIPHSSGGFVCADFLHFLVDADTTHKVNTRVNYFNLDAGKSYSGFSVGSLASRPAPFFFNPLGLWGFGAEDTKTHKLSHNNGIVEAVKGWPRGDGWIYPVTTKCAFPDHSPGREPRYCVHFGLLCTNPGPSDPPLSGAGCPTSLQDLESRFLEKIPFV